MTKARPQVLSLNGGEVDLEAIARSDIDSYANKAQVFENALPAIKGGMFRAPGTRYIGRTPEGPGGADLAAIVRTWRFSRAQAFTLELAHMLLRLVYGTGYVQAGAGAGAFDGAGWVDSSDGGASSSPTEPTWPPPPPPPPPSYDPGAGAGGYCVAADSFLADGRRASDVRVGDQILALGHGQFGLRHVTVEAVELHIEESVLIRAASGVELICSNNTPITQPDGETVRAVVCRGWLIAVKDDDGPRWERVVAVRRVGQVEVAKISAGHATYAAGRVAGRMLFTHNVKPLV